MFIHPNACPKTVHLLVPILVVQISHVGGIDYNLVPVCVPFVVNAYFCCIFRVLGIWILGHDGNHQISGLC